MAYDPEPQPGPQPLSLRHAHVHAFDPQRVTPNLAVPLDRRKEMPFMVAISAQATAGPHEVREEGGESNWRGSSMLPSRSCLQDFSPLWRMTSWSLSG